MIKVDSNELKITLDYLCFGKNAVVLFLYNKLLYALQLHFYFVTHSNGQHTCSFT